LFCGECEEEGRALLAPLKAQFGPNVKIGRILIERNSLVNHIANVVQFPNGEKYVVDVWKSLSTGKPAIYTEANWIAEWNKELGGTPTVTQKIY
jgi:hypothetical protein